MQRVLYTLLSIILASSVLSAEDVRCATWNMSWFPSGVPNRRAPDLEQERFRLATEAIALTAPSILFVQEVRDRETCDQLAVGTNPGALKVAVCSDFRDRAGIPMFQQCAILTSYPVVEAAAEGWHSFGLVDPPRGYAYALLDVGGELVACYGVHLKSNLVKSERDHQMNILKRELASAQLLVQTRAAKSPDGRVVSRFIIGGDFNTNMDQLQYLSESTLRSLLADGFTDSFQGVDGKDRVTVPARGQYPDVTFDYVLHKGFKSRTSVGVATPVRVSDHLMVLAVLTP